VDALAAGKRDDAGSSPVMLWLYRAPWLLAPGEQLGLSGWLSLQRRVLRERAACPEQWLLVNVDTVDWAALAEMLGFEASDSTPVEAAPSLPAPAQALLWAKLLQWAAPHAWDVFEALEAAAWSAPGQPGPFLREQMPPPSLQALADLQCQLLEGQEWRTRAQALETALAQTQEASEAWLAQLEQAQADLHRAHAEAQGQSEFVRQAQQVVQDAAEAAALADERAQRAQADGATRASERDEARQALATTQAQLKEAQEEGELLLLQLHQVQEELEAYFLQCKDKDAALAVAQADAQAATVARAQAEATTAQARAAAQAQAEQAQQAARGAAQHAAEAAKLAQAARAEAAARTTERDEARQALAAAQAEVRATTAARAQAEATTAQVRAEAQAQAEQAQQAARGAAQHAAEAAQLAQAARAETAARTTERDEARQALSTTQAQLNEAQEEGELLLLQLHQVQEELETYFLRAKELEGQQQSIRGRFERLQSRYPQAVDVDAVELASVDAAGAVPKVQWRLRGLAVAGRVWPQLVLNTSLEPAGPGLWLEGAEGSELAGGMSAPLVPKALAGRDPAQLEHFRSVGAQAWRVLVAAAAAVDEILASPRSVAGAPADFDPTFWRQSLGALAPVLRALPPVFRHDGVRLKREKVNPDYEHLWLSFTAATHGERRWETFELRLGAAQTLPGLFSHLPKLEFPLGADGAAPFEGWFEESRDDFGPKYELRADLSRRAFDLAVWAKLPRGSQTLLLSLIAALPAALATLERSGTRLARPWADWQRLLQGLLEVMRERLAPPRPTPRPTEPPAPTLPPVQVAQAAEPSQAQKMPRKPARARPKARS
jgi:hypothetical protein